VSSTDLRCNRLVRNPGSTNDDKMLRSRWYEAYYSVPLRRKILLMRKNKYLFPRLHPLGPGCVAGRHDREPRKDKSETMRQFTNDFTVVQIRAIDAFYSAVVWRSQLTKVASDLRASPSPSGR